jgi:peptidoglycan hydrolase-like protein with peptidoglycan-binding domain
MMRLRARWGHPVIVVVAAVLVGACSSSNKTSVTTAATTATTADPVAAAQARVTSAQSSLDTAKDSLTAANQKFCGEAKDYIVALDRYGKLFTDNKATVGDVKTAGADLAAPRESVSTAATGVSKAQADVAAAEKELADAQKALADAKATASSVVTSATTSPSTTTTTVVPPSTINRVKQAEADLTKASAAITDATPLVKATVTYNSAAFALQVAWLQLVADAGCLTDQQQADAVAQVTNYTVALQTQLQKAGYYKGPVDGVYGPQTVAAVEQLQTDSGLPTTGLVDKATALALDKKTAAVNQQAATAATSQTAAVQTVLKLTGYWTGPIDGQWTQELTDALKKFQTALGVEPTGAVDAATLAAFQQALAALKTSATSTTSSEATTTAAPSTTAAPTTTAAATTTTPTTAASTTTST